LEELDSMKLWEFGKWTHALLLKGRALDCLQACI